MRVAIDVASGQVDIDGVTRFVSGLQGQYPTVRRVQFEGVFGVVSYTTGDPPRMIDSLAEFSFALDGYSASVPVSELQLIAQAKAVKREYIERRRDEEEQKDVQTLGYAWQADTRSRTLLTGAVSLALAGLPLPSVWRTSDNFNYPITSVNDLLAIAGAMAQRTQAVYDVSWSKKTELDAATTIAQVEAITWS